MSSTLPRQTALPPGYVVRRMAGDDWEQAGRPFDGGERANRHPRTVCRYEPFVRASCADRPRIVRPRGCRVLRGVRRRGARRVPRHRPMRSHRAISAGRYDARHRRRGRASHLLGVAACWAADHGCENWVIVTEATNPAGRVYRSVGFEPDTASVQAYRSLTRPLPYVGTMGACPPKRLRTRSSGAPLRNSATRGETLARIRALIHDADPPIAEEWKWAKPTPRRNACEVTTTAAFGRMSCTSRS